MTTDPATDAHTGRLALAATAAEQAATIARLQALVVDVVAAGFATPAPGWLPDDLWARLVAETPRPEDYTPRPDAATSSTAHALF